MMSTPAPRYRHRRFPAAAKLNRGVTEFDTNIRNNQKFIPNFAERYRQGDTISPAFVESTINQVVSKRFVIGKQHPPRNTPYPTGAFSRRSLRCEYQSEKEVPMFYCQVRQRCDAQGHQQNL